MVKQWLGDYRILEIGETKIIKPKLNFEGLLEKLHDRKITNGSFTDDEIIDYLKTRSYYYKISSYRKNYPKSPQGGYANLTFNHLEITAKLDVRLREYLLNMCLDVEHALRTSMMTILTEDNQEDGYKIVENFQDEFPEKFSDILSHFRNNKYKQDMFNKRTQISVWVLMEIIDYGTLVQFLEFYTTHNTNHEDELYPYQQRFIKNIRNACAHNDVYLINIFDKTTNIPRPQPAIKSFATYMSINNGLVRYQKIIDLIALFFIHKRLCSQQLNQRRYDQGLEIFNYYQQHSNLLNHSTNINKFLNSILKKSIDFLIT